MNTTMQRWIALAALGAMILAPATCLAHQQAGQATGFLTGFLHPISGLDHVLAMVAVGLWGAVLGAPAIWVLPVAFPVVMALGGLLGMLGYPLPGVEIGIACSAIVLGIAVLAELRPPLWLATVIVTVFAVFHGHAHGSELPPGNDALLFSLGFVMATGLLHGVGILLGVAHRWSAGRKSVRVAGGGVALAGLYFLWSAIA